MMYVTMSERTLNESKISAYVDALERLAGGDYDVMVSSSPDDPFSGIGQAINRLSKAMDMRATADAAVHAAELAQKDAELRIALDTKNTFLAIAAHDLRSPLGTIGMAADLLMIDEFSLPAETRKQVLSDIRSQVGFMVNLISNLLDMAKMKSGRVNVHQECLKVETVLKAVVNDYLPEAAAKGISLQLDPLPKGDILADPARLRQVLDNLISNAIKFSKPGTVVAARALMTSRNWRFEVQDEGPGLTAKDFEHLFEDFARLSTRPTGGEKTTGLGLAISRRIVLAHGGDIGAESTPGVGSTFWFTIPLSRKV